MDTLISLLQSQADDSRISDWIGTRLAKWLETEPGRAFFADKGRKGLERTVAYLNSKAEYSLARLETESAGKITAIASREKWEPEIPADAQVVADLGDGWTAVEFVGPPPKPGRMARLDVGFIPLGREPLGPEKVIAVKDQHGGLSPNPRNFPNQVDSMVWVCCPAELPSFSPSRTH